MVCVFHMIVLGRTDRLPLLVTGLFGLAIYVITAAYNIGFVAVDDYYSGVAPVVPAQNASVRAVIDGSTFRSPIPTLGLLSLSHFALRLGITDPIFQFRFVLVCLALFTFGMNLLFGRKTLGLLGQSDTLIKQTVYSFLIGFYFLCPLFLTRTSVESLSAPFLMAAAYFAGKYFVSVSRPALLLSLGMLTLASVLRFQAGICFLALPVCVLVKRRPRDLVPLVIAGTAAFLLAGWVDYLMKGSFHASLLAYIRFNLSYSSTFGITPFYTFALLFLGLSIPPVFFSRYRGFQWRDEYLALFPALLFFVIFVAVHSVVPHKEERFMLPMVPIFLLLLTPLANYLWKKNPWSWRVFYFAALNFPLLILTSFNISEGSMVGAVEYIHDHSEISSVLGVNEVFYLFPSAFILRPVKYQVTGLSELKRQPVVDCHEVVAVRSADIEQANWFRSSYTQIAESRPGLLEALVIRLNPKRNGRRGSVSLWKGASCPGI